MTQKILEIIRNTLLIDTIEPDENLFEAGYLDSMALINLIVSLEYAFDINLSLETLELDQFNSVESIREMIEPMVNSSL